MCQQLNPLFSDEGMPRNVSVQVLLYFMHNENSLIILRKAILDLERCVICYHEFIYFPKLNFPQSVSDNKFQIVPIA